MVRTQIQLTKEQAKKLREMALENHESIASLIRQAVDQFLLSGKRDRSDLFRIAESVVGKYRSDKDDISVKHDRYLDKDFDS
jgi:hypothetical protein